MKSEEVIKKALEFDNETLRHFYLITPECDYNTELETKIKVLQWVLDIVEKQS